MDKTLVAVQIDPAYQSSVIYQLENEWQKGYLWSDVIVTGNRQFRGRTTPVFDWMIANLNDMQCAYEDVVNNELDGWQSIEDILAHFAVDFPGDFYNRYSELLKDTDYAKWWDKLLSSRFKECWMQDWLVALWLLTGKKYEITTLKGYSQGDWQHCLYPKDDYTKTEIRRLEAEYFNLGSEYKVGYIDSSALQDAEGIEAPLFVDEDWEYVYTHSWSLDDTRKEISSYCGSLIEAVFTFDGYIKTPKYVIQGF